MTEQPVQEAPDAGNAAAPEANSEGNQEKPELSSEELRDALAKARKEAAKYRTELRDAAGRLQEFEDRDKTEAQRQADELTRWQTEAEKWRTTSVVSTIKALAASDFEYPDDAVGALDPEKYLDAGGVIDEKAIRADLDGLLESRPKWRKDTGSSSPRLPAPNTSQGTSGKASAADPAQQFAAILQGQMQ
jgi:hypothetical protein